MKAPERMTMSDQDSNTQSEEPISPTKDIGSNVIPSQYRAIDPVLRGIAFLANLAHLEFPITVNVSGQLISGYVIGYYEYMRLLRSEFKPYVESFREDDREFVQELLNNAVLIPDSDKDTPPIRYDEIWYLNLRDARIFGTGLGHQIPTNKGLVWRSPLESIDGFSVGTLGVDPVKD